MSGNGSSKNKETAAHSELPSLSFIKKEKRWLTTTNNVQIAVENYFIVHGHVSNDRTDYNTPRQSRQIRSIQTERHFGDIKENENFRRFNYRCSEKVYKEFMLLR